MWESSHGWSDGLEKGGYFGHKVFCRLAVPGERLCWDGES